MLKTLETSVPKVKNEQAMSITAAQTGTWLKAPENNLELGQTKVLIILRLTKVITTISA